MPSYKSSFATRRPGCSCGSSTTSTAWPTRWSGRPAPTRKSGCTTRRWLPDEAPRAYRSPPSARTEHAEAGTMSLTVFTNAVLIDCTGADPREGAAVIVEDDRIKDVVRSGAVGALPGPVTTLDCRGATLMPGLTDAHVHFCAVQENVIDQYRLLPPSLLVARALRRAEECLMQGFTTVRDAGGSDYGLREAIAEGWYPGPRMLVSGNYISQTGGHGDKRRRSEWVEPVRCCLGM